MYAVIAYKGNQYTVSPNHEYKIDKLETKEKKIKFSDVLLLSDGNGKVEVGNPYIPNISVEAEVIGEGKGDKLSIFKFKAKKRYKRTLGHRQPHSLIKIIKINENQK